MGKKGFVAGWTEVIKSMPMPQQTAEGVPMITNANVSICRPSNGGISIEISDGMSSRRILTVRMELAVFAQCITGLSYVPASMEFYEGCQVGKRIESKREGL